MTRHHPAGRQSSLQEGEGDATRIAEEHSRAGRQLLITFGGDGMKIAPEARLVDGRLDLIVIRTLSFARILDDGARI